jgi:hypothetical protein
LAGLLLLTSIASFGLGAYLAGVLWPTLGATSPHEVEFRDGVHGLLVYGIAILITTALTLPTPQTNALGSDVGVLIRRIRAMGIRDRPVSARIGSIRRECVDHVVVIGERHLRNVIASVPNILHRGQSAPIAAAGRDGSA